MLPKLLLWHTYLPLGAGIQRVWTPLGSSPMLPSPDSPLAQHCSPCPSHSDQAAYCWPVCVHVRALLLNTLTHPTSSHTPHPHTPHTLTHPTPSHTPHPHTPTHSHISQPTTTLTPTLSLASSPGHFFSILKLGEERMARYTLVVVCNRPFFFPS